MCLFPINAQLDEYNKIKFTREGDLKLPCGKCTECISKRSLEWATRARHEISLHKENCFLTLTYNDESLPSIYVVKRNFKNSLSACVSILSAQFDIWFLMNMARKHFALIIIVLFLVIIQTTKHFLNLLLKAKSYLLHQLSKNFGNMVSIP